MFYLCNMSVKCFLVLLIIGCIEADLRLTSSGCMIPNLQHGRVRMRQRSKLVKFICAPRYELVGNKYATCRGTEWDVPLPVCVRAGCPLPKIDKGVLMPSRQMAWVVFFCLPGYKMIGSSTIYCDGRSWNGTAPKCVDATAPAYLKCDFEDPDLCGWTQDDLHDFDWKRLNKKTPSSFLFTGPSYDHTLGKNGSGYYMYIESTSRLMNDTARLISPLFDASLTNDGCFMFFYHMYGKTTGGLRVYEKPENYALEKLLNLPSNEKQKYILFEKWGNQGDVWYDAVLPLKNFSDNFQIVIEGIRGSSFTSDIAIDDVAILRGSNCTHAVHDATTPSINMPDSCAGRCDVFGDSQENLACSCTLHCIGDSSCCPDFFDICLFSTDSTTNVDDNAANTTVEMAPQTQKFVATSPETTTTTTTTPKTPMPITTTTVKKATFTTTTTTTTTTTPKPTTTTTITSKPTTITTTTPKTTTTPSSTSLKTTKAPRIVFKTTLPVHKFTNVTQKYTTVKTPSTKKTLTQTTTIKVSNRTTKTPIDYSRPIEDHDAYRDIEEKARKEHENEVQLEKTNLGTAEHKRHSSGLMTTFTTLVAVGCCAGLVWLIVVMRSTRGRIALARFRGRATSDPEVRYLSTDIDDE